MNNQLWLPDNEVELITTPNIDFTSESFGMLMGDGGQQAEIHRLAELNALLDAYAETKKLSGMEKWFVPGTPFSIDNCPKHKVFFEAGADYGQRLFMAANRCHAAGTKVWMADGTEKNIEDVIIGEKVLAYDVATDNLVETEVVDTFAGIAHNVHRYYTPTSNREILSTDDHPFLTRSQRGHTSQKQAKDFRYWDKVVVPTKWEMEGKDPGFSENVAKLIGLLVGDGYLCAKEGAIKLTNCNEEVLKFAETVAREELGLDPRYTIYKTYKDLFFPKVKKNKHKSSLATLLEELGLYGTRSGNKFVPKQIIEAPEGHVRAFIQGLLAADGHYSLGRVDLFTSSPMLATSYEKALLRLGVPCTKQESWDGNPNHARKHTIRVTGDSFVERIGTSIYKKPIVRGAQRSCDTTKGVGFKDAGLQPTQEIYCITVAHEDHLFVANGYVCSNSGKSVSGALESSFHATGLYPDWWEGKRFDGPTHGWAMGSTARATRDTVQKELVGPVGSWGTGMIPAESIGKIWALAGVPQGIDVMQVRHVSGGWSTIGFKNYEQPIEAFYGTALHYVWGDEIVPINVYNECLVRTMTTRGIIYITFTPLTGLTPLVVKFCEDADYLAGAKKILGLPTSEDTDEEGLIDTKSYKAIVQAGWDDAPWLDEEQKKIIDESSEPHLRETRRSGVPSMGSGAVYPLTLEQFVVDPFEIPDHFRKLYAMDVGWNRTAALWFAIDPNSGLVYIYDEHYIGEQPPASHAASIRSRGEWIPGVIDPASRGRAQGDGSQLMQTYKDLGLKIVKANNDVEGGIQSVWNLLSSGKIRIFSHLHNFAKEYVLYRRDEKGKIIKEKDHLMDVLRYGIVELHRAKSKHQLVRAPSYRGPTRYNI